MSNVKVIGVGDGGNSSLNRMIEAGLEDVEFIAVNTDSKALQVSKSLKRIQIGERIARDVLAKSTR